MIHVIKNDKKYPFSRGILARSLNSSGLSLKEAYELANKTRNDLEHSGKEVVLSSELKRIISHSLKELGHYMPNKYYLMRSTIKNTSMPLFILVGGGSGVGKSTISVEIAHRLGITRVVGTDTVREIMRSIISRNLIPTLHKSSFEAGSCLNNIVVDDKQIYAFQQQASLVAEGVLAVMRRATKEGLKMVINGVHLVPGFISGRLKNFRGEILQYILDIPDVEQHKNQFYERERGSLRNPERYVENMDSIRKTHEYILNMAKKNDVKIIENTNFEKTMRVILDDIMNTLEGRL